jgi:hypothetical protein
MSDLFAYRASLAALAALLTACPDGGKTSESSTGVAPTSEGSGTETSPTETSPTETSPTEATDTTDTSTGEQPPGEFGFVCVQLQPGEDVEADVFAGTRKITVTLNYEPCLVDYYTNKRPEMRQDGKNGAQVFAAWLSRLCSEDVPGLAECEVDNIDQILDQIAMAFKASVTYTIPEGGELAGRKLLWGPGPLPEFAECEGDFKPYVNLATLSGVVGYAADDSVLWSVQSFGEKRQMMSLDGLACIDANIKPGPP